MRQVRGNTSGHRNRVRIRGCAALCRKKSGAANSYRLLGPGRQGHADPAGHAVEGYDLIVEPRGGITAGIERAAAKGQPALVGYLTAGFPTSRQFKNTPP